MKPARWKNARAAVVVAAVDIAVVVAEEVVVTVAVVDAVVTVAAADAVVTGVVIEAGVTNSAPDFSNKKGDRVVARFALWTSCIVPDQRRRCFRRICPDSKSHEDREPA